MKDLGLCRRNQNIIIKGIICMALCLFLALCVLCIAHCVVTTTEISFYIMINCQNFVVPSTASWGLSS